MLIHFFRRAPVHLATLGSSFILCLHTSNLIPRATVATAKHPMSVVRRELSVKVKTEPLEVFQCTRTGLDCWGNTRHSPVYGMKLPAVCLNSTTLSIPRSIPVRQSRYLMVTPLTLPIIISPASAALPVSQSVPRLDPLHPPLAHRRTVSLETPAVHHHNHQRALVMQRKEHNRYHQVWRKPFYGSCTEREEYRSEVRQQLKRQMEEKRAGLMLKLTSKAEEAEFLQEVDRLALSSEKQQRIQHSRAMSHYRDENKKLMEQSWMDRALIRSQEALMERELLRHNPINWSGTLK